MGTRGSWWWFLAPLLGVSTGIRKDSGCLSTQPWALLRGEWGSRVCLKNPKEISGSKPKAFRSLLLPCPGMGRVELPWDSP